MEIIVLWSVWWAGSLGRREHDGTGRPPRRRWRQRFASILHSGPQDLSIRRVRFRHSPSIPHGAHRPIPRACGIVFGGQPVTGESSKGGPGRSYVPPGTTVVLVVQLSRAR